MVRARSGQTPKDAGPLVFTTGSDIASSTQLPVWLSRAGADVLKSHPIVAIDRRGIGMSSPIDCRDRLDRDEMRDQAQFQVGDDPVANLSEISNTATTNCTDTIAPGDSAYDNTFGIARKVWDNFFECVYAYKLEDYERKEAIGLVAKVPYRINAL